MRRFPAFIVIFGIIAVAAVAMRATAQDDPRGGPDGGDSGGPPPRNGPRGPGGHGGGFHLIPPFAVEKLNLTEDQQEQVAELEKETKAKLYKILTPKQQKTLETSRPPRPGRGGGPGGGPGDAGPGDDEPSRPQRPASE